MTSEDRDFERLKLLFDYTKFHIGLYATLTAALIALLNGTFLGKFRPEECPMWAAIFLIALAGLAGGVIASTVPQRNGADEIYKKKPGRGDGSSCRGDGGPTSNIRRSGSASSP